MDHDYIRCTLCEAGGTLESSEEVREVPSNVRRFRSERFTLWRCPHCRSIHARDRVALERYYAHYPLHGLTLSPVVRRTHRNRLGSLRRDGLTPQCRILDYGAGSGTFARFLRESGFPHAVAHDPHVADAATPLEAGATFDFIVLYDVIEHFDAPEELFTLLERHAHERSAVCIFTPDAARLDLTEDIHTLHQPYHRHVFSYDALVGMFERHGYRPTRTSRRHHADTWVPGLNHRAIKEYMKAHGYLLDSVFERIDASAFLRHPKLLLWSLLGYVLPSRSHVEVVFRRER